MGAAPIQKIRTPIVTGGIQNKSNTHVFMTKIQPSGTPITAATPSVMNVAVNQG